MKKHPMRLFCLLLALAAMLSAASCAADPVPPPAESGNEKETGEGPGEETEMNALEQLSKKYPLSVCKGKVMPKAITVVGIPKSFSEKVMLGTLQGNLANCSDTQILFQAGCIDYYKQYIKDGYDVRFASGGDAWNILGKFKNKIAGYILCDDGENESVNVAISLCGILNAVAVQKSDEKLVKTEGLALVLDVTGKDEKWLRESEYFDKLNKKIAVEQPMNMAPKLVDYAVMAGAYFSFYNGHSTEEHSEKFGFLDDGALVFGYNNTLGEIQTVDSFGRINACMIPSDHAFNLSTLSAFCKETAEQKTFPAEGKNPEKVHTVCFILSDGDNMQWLTNDFITSDRWYNSPLRGEFEMGWGLPATAIDVTAPVVDYLYDTMKPTDEFIMELSGLGYTFPSRWDPDELTGMAYDLSSYMSRSGLKYAEILDDHGFNTDVLGAFTYQEGIDGIFYIDYGNYAEYKGKILWSDGKPIVSARYRLWNGLEDGKIENVAAGINKASRDPSSPDAYSFVIVHAWSGADENGKQTGGGSSLRAISEVINLLKTDVDVVTPTEFMDRIVRNLGKDN